MESEASWRAAGHGRAGHSGALNNKPRNRSNLSPVWRYFSRIGDARSCLGSCLYCGTEVAVPGGSTTGMFSHLSVHHPEVYREAKDQQLAYKPRLDPRPIDLSGRVLAAPPPLLPHPHVSHVFPVPQVVAVKPLEPRHVQLSVFPFLYHSYLKMAALSPAPHEMQDSAPYDLVVHCRHGVLVANKLMLAAVSHFARQLLEECRQQVSHLVLVDIELETMEHFVRSIYHGTLNFRDENLHQIFDIFGIPYNVKTNEAAEDNSLDDIGEDSDDSYIEPVLQLDIGKASVETGSIVDDDSEAGEGEGGHRFEALVTASESDIEARAQELKDKIFAECGLVPRRGGGRLVRNTRNPSKIWRWFTKTPTFIYCKVCGLGIKNSGNTTNASSHLKRHPEQYAEFKMESAAQMMEACSDTADTLAPNVEEEYDRMVWKYFQISKKANRKAKCYLCGKETPMGSSNVLLHLRHHHAPEHARIVERVARSQGGGGGGAAVGAGPSPVIKTEPEAIQIKVEIEETETEPDDQT